jgi:hypothetical protein
MTDPISLAVNKERDAELFQAKAMANIAFAVTLFAFATTVFEIIRRTYQWLRYGESQVVSLSTLFGTPSISWTGVQRIITLVWESQLLVVAVAVLFLAGFLYGILDDVASSVAAKARYGLKAKEENQ